MTILRFYERYIAHYRSIPALCYGAVVLTLVMTTLFAVTNIFQRHHAIFETAEALTRLEHRTPASSAQLGREAGDAPQGSPFLEGQTITVASAALLQRVTAAITRVGGNVVSSEVEPQDVQSADGLVRITTTSELEQKAVQQLLYDIEAGMPFLFVDQFLAQAPQPANEGGRMRVVLEVSGLWPGTKRK